MSGHAPAHFEGSGAGLLHVPGGHAVHCTMKVLGQPLPLPAQMRRFNLGPVGEADCPVFDGMMEYFQASASCSAVPVILLELR